jgi:hypothetical protein
MRTWRRALVAEKCGFCNEPIARGAVLLEIGSAKKLRCQPCGEAMFEEQAPELPPLPDRVEDARASVPEGVRHQPSLGYEDTPSASAPSFVSSGELERRRIARAHSIGGRR